MAFRYTLMGAAALTAFSTYELRAQSPGEQQRLPCADEFRALRDETNMRFEAAKTAIAKKETSAELCNLLMKFSQAQNTLAKFVEKNGATCGFPPPMLESIKGSSTQTEGYRKRACFSAANRWEGDGPPVVWPPGRVGP